MSMETDENAECEDAVRRHIFVEMMHSPEIRDHSSLAAQLIDPESLRALLRKLHRGDTTAHPPETLASALHFRTIRFRLVDALLREFVDAPDDDLRTFTLINTKWRLTPRQLNDACALRLANSLRTHLKRAGIADLPGFLVAVLHGEFEAMTGCFQLHFHGLTTAAKAGELYRLRNRWGYETTFTGACPILIRPVQNREAQFSYLFQSFWPLRSIFINHDGKPIRGRRKQRIVEPYHTQYLLWLDRYQIQDLVLVNKARIIGGEIRVNGCSGTRNCELVER